MQHQAPVFTTPWWHWCSEPKKHSPGASSEGLFLGAPVNQKGLAEPKAHMRVFLKVMVLAGVHHQVYGHPARAPRGLVAGTAWLPQEARSQGSVPRTEKR